MSGEEGKEIKYALWSFLYIRDTEIEVKYVWAYGHFCK